MPTRRILYPEKETEAEKNIYNLIRKYIVGNEKAVKMLSRDLYLLSALGGQFRATNKPAGKFTFLGCTGSGKSFFIKVIAKLLFGNFNAYTKISGGEYQLPHQITRLTGASQGYIGFDTKPDITQEGLDYWGYLSSIDVDPIVRLYSGLIKKRDYGFARRRVLTDGLNNLDVMIAAINNSSRSTNYQEANNEISRINKDLGKWLDKISKIEEIYPNIKNIEIPVYERGVGYPSLFEIDEIEKADEAVLRLFFDVLDEGQLITSGQYGEVVSFVNSIIFMTSNIGQEEMLKISKIFGFTGMTDIEKVYEKKRLEMHKTVYEQFVKRVSQEFVGRVGYDRIFTFTHLSPAEQADLLKNIMIPRYNNQLKELFPVIISISQEAQNFLLASARTEEKVILGVRPLNDIFKLLVEDNILSLIARSPEEGGLIYGDTISIKLEPKKQNSLVFSLTKRSKKAAKEINIDIEKIRYEKEFLNEEGVGFCKFIFDKAA